MSTLRAAPSPTHTCYRSQYARRARIGDFHRANYKIADDFHEAKKTAPRGGFWLLHFIAAIGCLLITVFVTA